MDVKRLAPFKTHSLDSFNDRALDLLAEAEEGHNSNDPAKASRAEVEVLHFVLTGQDRRNGTTTQLSLLNNAVTEDFAEVEIVSRCDFDSLLGWSYGIPLRSHIDVYSIVDYRKTLTSNVHLKHAVPITGRPNTFESVPYHKIPNLALFTMDPRNTCRLMLPSLRNRLDDKNRPDLTIPTLVQRELYNDCVRPAALSVEPGEAGHWGASYDAEIVRQRGPGGKLSYGTQRLPAESVSAFGRHLMDAVNEKDWGRGAFFFYEFRGTRGATTHDRVAHRDALRAFIDVLDAEEIDLTHWFVDIGCELQSPGQVLWWRKDAHWRVISHCLGLEPAEAQEIASSSRLCKDAPCQLSDIAGFRLETNSRDRRYTQIAYMQAYNTEKSVTYSLTQGSNCKQLSLEDIANDPKATQHYAEAIAAAFKAAEDTHDGNARIEARVPLTRVHHEILTMDSTKWAPLLIALPRPSWWLFKQIRLKAMSLAIMWWGADTSDLRSNHLAVGLVAALVWQINALNNRAKDDSEGHRQLARALLPFEEHTEVDQVDGEQIDTVSRYPVNPYGIFFIARIQCDNGKVPVPRLSNELRLDQDTLDVLLKGGAWARVMDKLRPVVVRAAAVPNRVTTKTSVTRSIPTVAPDAVLTRLEARGHALNPIMVDDGSDLDSDDDMRPELLGGGVGLDRELTTLFKQFLVDLLFKIPNPTESTGFLYCALDATARMAAADTIFQEPNLAVLFNHVQVKQASVKEWNDVFACLWPSTSIVLPKCAQGYGSWLSSWMVLLGHLEPDTAKAARTELRRLFNDLRWMVAATTTRVWDSHAMASYTKLTIGHQYPSAPRIILNPRFPQYSFVTDRVPANPQSGSQAATRPRPKRHRTMADYFAQTERVQRRRATADLREEEEGSE